MEQQELISFISQPQRLGAQSLKQLQEELHRYPYCQTFQLLYACNLYLEGLPEFTAQLKKAAAYAADRRKLKHLIDLTRVSAAGKGSVSPKPLPEVRPVQSAKPVPETENPTFPRPGIVHKQEPVKSPAPESAIQSHTEPVRMAPVLPDLPEEPAKKVVFKPIPITDPDHGPVSVREKLLEIVHQRLSEIAREHDLEQEQDDISPEYGPIPSSLQPERISFRVEREAKLSKNELIDRFIREEPRMAAPRTTFLKPIPLSPEKLHEDDEIVSETLAILYWKQGNHGKSIRVYQKLCLLFPEKSSYFAARIEELKAQHGPDQKEVES